MPQSSGQQRLSWFQRSERWQMFTASPMVVASAVWLAFIVLVAVLAPALVAERANFQNLSLRFFPPFQIEQGIEFILGGDSLGRPILLQLAMGAQTSMIIAFFAVGISSLIGYAIGLVAGYFGGWVDNSLLRIADILHTVPSMLLALVVLFILEPSIFNVIIVLGITRIPVYLRTARAQTVEIRERTFVEVARSMGASHWRIMTREIAPLVFPTIRTLAVLEVAMVILAAASLTFLGIGLQRPDVDWGMMVADGKTYLKTAWFVAVFPGVVIVLTALSASILSNWLRAVEDPTQNILFARKPKPSRGKAP
ncbi:ABC transporter permease [Devosia nitrariae]|uniref:ABC transporter permease n=2 Tax=Devosia nitrariae TaxID=2071872 RepID=A0ABQ5W3U1_9HYPH|nr:ABC transporter permease [Devosia nitrariae]